MCNSFWVSSTIPPPRLLFQGGKANAFNRLLTSWNSGSTSIYHHCGGYDNNGYRRLTFGWNDNDYDESCDHSSEDDGCDNYDERGYHYRRHRRMTDYYWGGSGSSDSKDSSDDYKPSCDQSGGSTDNSESSDSLSKLLRMTASYWYPP